MTLSIEPLESRRLLTGQSLAIASILEPSQESVLHLVDLDGSNGFRIDGIEENTFSGIDVTSVGDINGDGFDDVAIGTNGSRSPSVYVVFGSSESFPADLGLDAQLLLTISKLSVYNYFPVNR